MNRVIVFTVYVLMLTFVNGIFAADYFADGVKSRYGTSKAEKQEDEGEKYVQENTREIFNNSLVYFEQMNINEFPKDISTFTKVINSYFVAIYQLLKIEYPDMWEKGDKGSIEDLFIQQIWEWDAQKQILKLTSQEIQILSEKIDTNNIQYPWNFLKQQIEKRKKICESLYPKIDWHTLLQKIQESNPKQNRKNWFRNWYLTNSQNDFNFQKSSQELRNFIFENYLELPADNYGTVEANSLLNWKENSGLQDFLDSEDCQKRPWYVADRFFTYMNLERFQKCEGYEELCKFLPKNRGELGWNREVLKTDQYAKNIQSAIKNWLILKFGYTKDSPELQNKDLNQLLALLKENFESVRPYHRFLYDQIQDESLKNFLNHFIN